MKRVLHASYIVAYVLYTSLDDLLAAISRCSGSKTMPELGSAQNADAVGFVLR